MTQVSTIACVVEMKIAGTHSVGGLLNFYQLRRKGGQKGARAKKLDRVQVPATSLCIYHSDSGTQEHLLRTRVGIRVASAGYERR
jgi:hypothetical protein